MSASSSCTRRRNWLWCRASTKDSAFRPSKRCAPVPRSSPPTAARSPRSPAATATRCSSAGPVTPTASPLAFGPRSTAPTIERASEPPVANGSSSDGVGSTAPTSPSSSTAKCSPCRRTSPSCARTDASSPVLTIRFDRLGLRAGDLVLDVGAGFGRHCFEVARRGGRVVALDYAADEVKSTRATLGGMVEADEIPVERYVGVLQGDGTRLPFPDATFDRVITSEVLEHIQDDVSAIAEMVRVLRPGGTFAATVPSWLPEKINWMLSDDYHAPKAMGGHVRIYTATELEAKLRAAGLDLAGSHHAHALHSPYWWLKCAVGPKRDDSAAVNAYKRFLEWDIVKAPRLTRTADRVLNPVLGKSLVVYGTKVHQPVEVAR